MAVIPRVDPHAFNISAASRATNGLFACRIGRIHPPADGRLVVFESDATNLVAGDSNQFTDVFVNDPSALAPPPPAPARCIVPRVVGFRLATARTRIVRAKCRVGRVRRARSRRVGRVLSQSPRARSVRPRGTRVNLVVGRR